MEEREKEERQRQTLLYVELPNLVHRILRMSAVPLPRSKRVVEITIEEIQKITNAEYKSALESFNK